MGGIYPHDFGTRYIDGFMHISSDNLSMIHMNCALPPGRWRWTLAHELGHLGIPREFPSDAADAGREADTFAVEFLAPAYEITPSSGNLDEPALFRLKAEWRISMSSLIRRASDLGLKEILDLVPEFFVGLSQIGAPVYSAARQNGATFGDSLGLALLVGGLGSLLVMGLTHSTVSSPLARTGRPQPDTVSTCGLWF